MNGPVIQMSEMKKNYTISKIFINSTIILLLTVLLIIPTYAGELSVYTNDKKTINEFDYGLEYLEPGFVFSFEMKNLEGLSEDLNNNKVEDFLEYNQPLFSSQQYISVIISLTKPADEQLIDGLKGLGCRIDQVFTIIDAVGASVPVSKLNDIGRLPTVKLIQNVREVESYLNYAVPLVKASQDKLSAAGYSGITGEGVTVAVIDSGVDGGHSTFSNRIIAFRDFVYGNNDLDPTDGMNARDYGYHGTMCASCAVGSGTYRGVAIKANLIAIAVENTYDMIQAIEWCVNNQNQDFNKDGKKDGPDVITMSLGVSGTYSYLDNAAGAAMDNGVVFVTSAGNDGPGDSTVTSPATSAKVIAVGATDKYNKAITSFSSRGPGPGGIIKPNVVAPGLNLVTAYPGNQWTGGGSGTSFSSPIVAGICALILQYDPDLDPYEVRKILEDSAEDLGTPGPDNTYGYGFVDAIAALDKVLKVKSLTASEKSVIEDTSVTFTAIASGTNVNNYEWDWENNGVFDSETKTNSASHIFTKSGTYTVRVQVTNQKGKTAEGFVDVKVVNREPEAKLDIDGQPEYIYEDDTLFFNASRSWDTPSDINNLEFSWSFNDGLNYTNFTRSNSIVAHSFNRSGEYNIIVKVRDDDNIIDNAQKSIIIANYRPEADAGDDKIVFEDEPVQFSGFKTYDTKSDLQTLNYTWLFGDGKKGFGVNTTHSYQITEDNQSFTVTLTVIDDNYENNQDKIKVIVRNRPPTISISEDMTANEDQMISLTGIGNDSRNDNTALTYKWDFGDDEGTDWLEDANITHKYTDTGTYHPRLYVRDPKGAVNSKNLNITILNVKPEARFSKSKNLAEEDEPIKFDAGLTKDTESDINDLSYMWNFGDGTIGFGKEINHKFYQSKRYTVVLKVTDDNGAVSTFEDNIQVSNRVPTAKVTVSKKEINVKEIVYFYGYQSSDTVSDQRNLTYYWDFRDGSGFQISGINTTYKYTTPGEYVVRLKVEDDDLESNIAKVTIKVIEPKEEVDILKNPTIENRGFYIYAGIAVFIVILIILLLSLLMYYNNKKGLFGIMERRMEERKERKERESQLSEERINLTGESGLTFGQEQFYKDLYGVHPAEFKKQMNIENTQAPVDNDMNTNNNLNIPPNFYYPNTPQSVQQIQSMPPIPPHPMPQPPIPPMKPMPGMLPQPLLPPSSEKSQTSKINPNTKSDLKKDDS